MQSFDQSFLCKKYVLNHHKHSREGEKPYKCGTCDRSFTFKKYFITHQRSHTGEKPYQGCSCDMAYANKMSLEGHQITHTEKQIYHCSHCDLTVVYATYSQVLFIYIYTQCLIALKLLAQDFVE